MVMHDSLALLGGVSGNPFISKFLPDLQKTHTEWRWRFFDIKGRKLIEISKQNPNENRIYMDNMGKWISFTLDNSWDQYVVDIKYCYVK